MKKIQGIYAIENIINGKKYIGQVCHKKGASRRFIEHKSLLKLDKHYNKYLQNAWNKYGESNFEFKMLEIVEDISLLNDREQNWIDQNIENCYNIQLKVGNYLNKNHNEVTKKKIGDANRKRIWTDESRNKLSISQKLRTFSEETIQKMKISHTGMKHNEATKLKIKKSNQNLSEISKENKKNATIHSNKTRVWKEESKEKIRLSRIGKSSTPESRIKCRNAMAMKLPKKGFKGVSHRSKNSWQAKIRFDGETIIIGSYSTAEEAARKYDEYALMLYGENNCYLNFPIKS